jgi:uncharacterized membrane protein
MSPLAMLALAAFGFVATHFALSHPLRPGLVASLGERRFQLAYTVIALGTFGWMVHAAGQVRDEVPLWIAGDAAWLVASLLMWLGSILFIGSLRRNPAFPRVGAPMTRIEDARGVFAITRHPMNWGFASWALVHIMVDPKPSVLLLSAAILILALGGSVGQDAKKRRLLGDVWRDWEARTAFVPFWRGFAWPGTFAFVGGTILFFAATWAHGALGAMPAGFWRWFG